MPVNTSETRGFEEIVWESFDKAADQLGYGKDEVLAAFAPSDRHPIHATLAVNGTSFESFRYEVGVVDPAADRSRGGVEFSPDVTGEKIYHKAVTMYVKHLLGDTGNVGGKSGIQGSPEAIAALSPEERQKLFAQYTEVHNVNPDTNVVATDIGTSGSDMDAVAQALVARYGDKAGAAASGASQMYGGEPELHAPHTGLGASMVLEAYLQQRAETDKRVEKAIRGEGPPLRVLVQGLGKAGAHFTRTMPPGTILVGAMEQYGAIVSENGALDPEQVLKIAKATRLGGLAVGEIPGTTWLDPGSLSEFWASARADIIVPAFDRNQVDTDDAQTFGGIVAVSVANGPLTPGAQKTFADRQIDVLPDAATNIGGTLSSQGIWDRVMNPTGWTPEGFEETWSKQMQNVAEEMLGGRAKLSAERGGFVSFPEVVSLMALERAVSRLRTSK